MSVNNKGAGQRRHILTPVFSTFINTKAVISTSSGVAHQTRITGTEYSNGDLEDRDTADTESRGFFTITVDNE
jgi:hypothetical protein